MMFVYVPPPKPSPQAEELGQKMAELIRIYRESYSDLNMTEVKQAMGIAENDVRPDLGGRNPKMAMVMGLLLGWLRLRSGSLAPSMLAHFVHNLLAISA
jgi:hypothetical protein